uniref:F-box domain-containing protein n=1 Tax=Leersia perrieri TaxID=77586 RepID=A0A0D9WZU0_9ORYZ
MENGQSQVTRLTDDLVVEILRRLPAISICRSWRDLIADHDHRKKLPQTLTGFFYESHSLERCPEFAHHFSNVTRRVMPLVYPSFSFLPKCDRVAVMDCCNGLLLCSFYPSVESTRFNYAVCNPATKEWVMLPDAHWDIDETQTACLCFDPAISSHFHVVEYVGAEDF